jgi:transposase-like protein
MLDEPGFLRQIVGRVLQELLEAEITEHIGAAPYERSVTRKGRRNGCKPRTLRTINGLERLNQEIKRRTRAVRIFPNREACLRLVALAVEQSEEWVTGRRYLDMRELKEHR